MQTMRRWCSCSCWPLCLAAVFASLTSQQMTSKLVALLGILTALSAVLRTIPGPAGFNANSLLPILSGYCYGPAFGFMRAVVAGPQR